MYALNLNQLSHLTKSIWRQRCHRVSILENLCSILGRNSSQKNSSFSGISRVVIAGRSRSCVLLVEADPYISVVCFGVSAGGIEHALNRGSGAGNVGPA